jgi:uncharacterized protein
MRQVFADAVYWVAIAHRKDQWHARAVEASRQLGPVQLVTIDEVLDEFLAHFSAFGSDMRQHAAATVRSLLADDSVRVIPQSRQSFLAGLSMYESRPDKDYSLTDCIAMTTMRQEALTEVLTHDAHFLQEGFRVLL